VFRRLKTSLSETASGYQLRCVKAKLVADKVANFTRIDVDTTNREVSLNGVVESPEQKLRADQLAMEVSGVRRVDNNLQIQKTN